MTSSDQLRTEGNNTDLDLLVYKFDVTRPWQYFRQGYPLASSVEKGRRTLSTNNKFKKVYVAKRKRTQRRKNAAFKDLNQLELTCCESGCLLRQGVNRTKVIIRQQRNMLYQKAYNVQNYLFSKLMEVKLTLRGVRKISYRVPSLGKVCKTAFRKVYGISNNKIRVLLEKMDLEGPSVAPDRRGQNSYDATESHYRRSRTGSKKYFNSNISMRQMWAEFVREHPHLRTTSLRRRNKGPVISFSAFRNLFNSELKDVLSFRKPRLDTCQICDKTKNRLDYLTSLANRNSKQDDDLRELTTLKKSHLKESEVRFASLKYDVTVLASKI